MFRMILKVLGLLIFFLFLLFAIVCLGSFAGGVFSTRKFDVDGSAFILSAPMGIIILLVSTVLGRFPGDYEEVYPAEINPVDMKILKLLKIIAVLLGIFYLFLGTRAFAAIISKGHFDYSIFKFAALFTIVGIFVLFYGNSIKHLSRSEREMPTSSQFAIGMIVFGVLFALSLFFAGEPTWISIFLGVCWVTIGILALFLK